MASKCSNLGVVRPPSVDTLAKSLLPLGLPHQLRVEAARRAILNNDFENVLTYGNELRDQLLRPVINATGVILHTNLGRAPLNRPPREETGFRASNLEFDLGDGKRGSRDKRVGTLIARYIGAESAIVVNNGAAAVFLVLAAHAPNRAVAISRGELVEIGGGFRIPEVLTSSGAILVEVGTTNKTRITDYKNAIENNDVALVLKVHSSNYKMVGFTQSVKIEELAKLGVPVIYDLGSGLLDENAPWMGWPRPSWLSEEPGAKQAIASGADLITFSGDKLMGGPQGGIIAGQTELVNKCAKHPLYRAMRPGGLVLAEMQETIVAYLDNRADQLPLWQMAKLTPEQLKQRAIALNVGEPVPLKGAIGGGSVPGLEIDSFGILVKGDLTKELRHLEIPIIARMEGSSTVIDLRTVSPKDDGYVAKSIAALL